MSVVWERDGKGTGTGRDADAISSRMICFQSEICVCCLLLLLKGEIKDETFFFFFHFNDALCYRES